MAGVARGARATAPSPFNTVRRVRRPSGEATAPNTLRSCLIGNSCLTVMARAIKSARSQFVTCALDAEKNPVIHLDSLLGPPLAVAPKGPIAKLEITGRSGP